MTSVTTNPESKPRSGISIRTRKMTLVACLATLSIVGRIYMAGVPNVQPSTMIIICTSLVFGVRFGLTLAFLTVVGSNMVLGFGTFAIMQIIAWGSVAVVSGLLGKRDFYKKIPHVIMACFAGFSGFIFGFFVSLDMLVIGGFTGFWIYYLRGIPFDIYHAVGNFMFYIILAPILIKLISTQKAKIYGGQLTKEH